MKDLYARMSPKGFTRLEILMMPGKCIFTHFRTSLIHVPLVFPNAIKPVHENSNNEVCATSKASDQPAHTRSLIRAFASRLSIL